MSINDPDDFDETVFELTSTGFPEPELEAEAEGEEFTIEQLGAAYARVTRQDAGEVPAEPVADPSASMEDDEESFSGPEDLAPLDDSSDDAACPVSEESVLEAAIFVGAPADAKLTSKKLAAIMREISPKEIKGIVTRLNERYTREHSAWRIVQKDGGWQMELIPGLNELHVAFQGEVREAKLAQSAIDVLAIVAYHQPVSRQEVERIWQRPCSAVLSQLVQRRLLEYDSAEAAKRDRLFVTSDRFLELMGLESLEDLPQTADVSDVGDF